MCCGGKPIISRALTVRRSFVSKASTHPQQAARAAGVGGTTRSASLHPEQAINLYGGLPRNNNNVQVKVAVEADGKREKICFGQHSQSPRQVLVDGLLDRVDARLCKSARKLNFKARGRGRTWAREWSEAYRVDSCASGLFQIALAVAGPIAVSARSL